MGNTVPLTTAPELSSVDGDNDTVISDRAVTAFLELAQDLELYIDDLVWRPTFHRLVDLPIELRYQIYELYFDDDVRAFATMFWPDCYFWPSLLRKVKSAPYMPDLCLANKSLLKEVGSFLLASLRFEFRSVPNMMHFFDKAAQFQSSELNIIQGIRELVQQDTNNCDSQHAICPSGQRTPTFNMTAIVLSNRSTSIALHMLQNITHLTLCFYAPVEVRRSKTIGGPPIFKALSIHEYLDGFNASSISRLKNLRSAEFLGYSGYQNVDRYAGIDLKDSNWVKDDEECLAPLVKMTLEVKMRPKARGQEVEVVTAMHYGKNSEGDCSVQH